MALINDGVKRLEGVFSKVRRPLELRLVPQWRQSRFNDTNALMLRKIPFTDTQQPSRPQVWEPTAFSRESLLLLACRQLQVLCNNMVTRLSLCDKSTDSPAGNIKPKSIFYSQTINFNEQDHKDARGPLDRNTRLKALSPQSNKAVTASLSLNSTTEDGTGRLRMQQSCVPTGSSDRKPDLNPVNSRGFNCTRTRDNR